VGILLSYSRAAWLNFAVAAVVMGAVFALRRNGGRQALVFVGVLAVALLTIAAAVSLTGQESFLQQRARLQTYDTQRFAAQSAGFELGTRHPIGVGPGQFELYEPISAHSTYVRALAEEGPLGFLVLVTIMAGTLLLAVANAVRARDTHGIASTVLLAGWCGILANSVFIDTLHWRHLWLLAGLIWCGAANQTSSYAGARSPM
jgi:O-antigen ligase